MDREEKNKVLKRLVLTLKISVGSCISIYIAEMIGLSFAASAGIITMLTIVTTKWETLKLSFLRMMTFLFSVALTWIFFQHINSEWIAYGLFLFILIICCDRVGWKATISVNAVIGTHFLQTHDFSVSFIMNEFLLVAIGILMAIAFNLFHNNVSEEKKIVENMRYAEQKLQLILEELASYLYSETMGSGVWEDIIALEKKLAIYTEQAYEFQNNTFHSHPSYYIHYFEMRAKQCDILNNLHYEIRKIRNLPKQARIIADYITYLKDFVVEWNHPRVQLECLHKLLLDMRKDELPKTREEFESRAKLYHILMDIEEFIIYKKRFIELLDDKQMHVYWRK